MAARRLAATDTNTLIFVMSDNGPTIEGADNGRFDLSGTVTTIEQMMARLDDLGGPQSSPTYPRGWAPLGATPFARWKGTPYAGGIRAPLIVTWPAVIRDRGAVRPQFVETVDVTPTVLDVTGIPAPKTFAGVEQFEMAGRSIRATFTDARAATRQTQFFMLRGNRAIRHGGWKAVTTHTAGTSFDDDKWELYHSDVDYSEAQDVAAQHPAKLKELQALWQSEAEKYGSLPLVEGGRGRRGGRGGEAPGRGRGAGGRD